MVPKFIEKFNFIIDLDKSKIQIQRDLVDGLMSLFQDNFNGFSEKTFIFRPSKIFMFIWNSVIKPLINQKT